MSDVPEISVTELSDYAVLVDVREQNEWAAGHAPGAIHIPLGDVPARLADLAEANEPVAIVCRTGSRSGRAVAWLQRQGFDAVNVEGGMQAWNRAGKPMLADGGQQPTVL